MCEYASELPDFADLLRATAEWRGQRTAIVEKDYYLSRALCSLCQKNKAEFILKGGTSLTKGWQLLQRFSEDIDILVIDPGWGKARKDTRLKNLEKTVASTKDFVYAQKPGPSETGVHRTVVFAYPSVADDVAALSKTIRLEMGYRGDTTGAATRPVQSMISEFAAYREQSALANDLRPFDVDMQNPCMTFVEKLFAVHSAYSENHALGKARHYYDLYELCALEEVRVFVRGDEYLKSIAAVRHRSQEMFPQQKVLEVDSFAESVALRPDADGLRILERNYQLESVLFIDNPPQLASILERIRDLLSAGR